MLDAHPGPESTAGPLAAGLDIPTAAIETELHRLQAQGLVVDLGPGRHRPAPGACTDAAGVTDRVVDPALRQAQLRMCTWYLRRTAAAGTILDPLAPRVSPVFAAPDPDHDVFHTTAAARAWIDAEYANVLAAQHLAQVRGWHELAFQFAEALWTPLRITRRTADLADVQRIGADAAAHCGHRLESVCRARQATGESARGRHDDALATCTVAVERATALHDPWALAIALATRAALHCKVGDIRAAQCDERCALDPTRSPRPRTRPTPPRSDHPRPGRRRPGRALHPTHAARLFGITDGQIGPDSTVISMMWARSPAMITTTSSSPLRRLARPRPVS